MSPEKFGVTSACDVGMGFTENLKRSDSTTTGTSHDVAKFNSPSKKVVTFNSPSKKTKPFGKSIEIIRSKSFSRLNFKGKLGFTLLILTRFYFVL